jgi:ribokinase
VYGETDDVRALLTEADCFFLNENEANGLFGDLTAAQARPAACLFVTLGERGALVIQGDSVTPVPGCAAREVDPTGAGDTFCGATLAGLARGLDPVAAAEAAVSLAARVIEQPGPAALLN